MPAGDGTGPMGQGPMTGRGAGYCAGFDAPGYTNPMPGRGFGMGWGRGYGRWGGRGRGFGRGGRRNWGYGPAWGPPAPWAYDYGPYAAPPTPAQETEALRAQAEWLKEQLDAITTRIEELEQEE
jgi:hypothetical protein